MCVCMVWDAEQFEPFRVVDPFRVAVWPRGKTTTTFTGVCIVWDGEKFGPCRVAVWSIP